MKIDFEHYMQEKHAEQYVGIKECMVDDFADWCDGLSIDDWFIYGNEFARDRLVISKMQENKQETRKMSKLFAIVFETIREQIELLREKGLSDTQIVDIVIRVCKENEGKSEQTKMV